jgi:chorismate mutase/prephenate dehydratase
VETEREKALLEKLEALNEGPMEDRTLRAIYREIMSGALALEHPLQVGYLGPQATFSHLAAMGKFGHSVKYEPKSNIADVFRDVETERLDYGCVPIENSTEGAVNHTLDMFTDSSVQICAEMNLRIHHNLIAKCEFSEIKKVLSHAQVLGQCKSWLHEHMTGVEIVEVASSTKAAGIAASEKGCAAIASILAAELYGLKILHEKIEDNAHNTTRFMVIGRQAPAPTGEDKTSICFSIKDRVGVLYDCLLPFKEEDITLTMIESRPSRRRKWEYFFFIDLLGHSSEEKIKRALEKLENLTQSLRILGSYPRSNVML